MMTPRQEQCLLNTIEWIRQTKKHKRFYTRNFLSILYGIKETNYGLQENKEMELVELLWQIQLKEIDIIYV